MSVSFNGVPFDVSDILARIHDLEIRVQALEIEAQIQREEEKEGIDVWYTEPT